MVDANRFRLWRQTSYQSCEQVVGDWRPKNKREMKENKQQKVVYDIFFFAQIYKSSIFSGRNRSSLDNSRMRVFCIACFFCVCVRPILIF